MRTICMHLISDSTGETLHAVARAIQGKFEDMSIEQYSWPLTRTIMQAEDVLSIINSKPGIVLCTVVDSALQDLIQKSCRAMKVPCVPVLNKIIYEVSAYINMTDDSSNGALTTRTAFTRAEAIDYTIAHDDGQLSSTWSDADVIIIGVSRTAKTPTSIYLAYRGYKVANIPFVLESPMPDLRACTSSLIVGLTVSSDRLLSIRRNRAIDSNLGNDSDYTSIQAIEQELKQAKIFCKRNNWPIIDASKKSVEEIAATIIRYYNKIAISK